MAAMTVAEFDEWFRDCVAPFSDWKSLRAALVHRESMVESIKLLHQFADEFAKKLREIETDG